MAIKYVKCFILVRSCPIREMANHNGTCHSVSGLQLGIYRIFDDGDRKPMGDGGMMTKPPHIPMSNWTLYFNVDSIQAAIERVKSGSANILNGPMQAPGGNWIIQGHDPQGVMFSLVSTNE